MSIPLSDYISVSVSLYHTTSPLLPLGLCHSLLISRCLCVCLPEPHLHLPSFAQTSCISHNHCIPILCSSAWLHPFYSF